MYLKPVFDLGWVAGISILGMLSIMYLAPLTILAEAMIIWSLLIPTKEHAFWHSMKDAIVMNIVSGGIGFLLIGAIPPSLYGWNYFEVTHYEAPPMAMVVFVCVNLVVLCIASIVIEAIVLELLERNCPRKSIWLITTFSNLVSYLLLFAIIIIRVIG